MRERSRRSSRSASIALQRGFQVREQRFVRHKDNSARTGAITRYQSRVFKCLDDPVFVCAKIIDAHATTGGDISGVEADKFEKRLKNCVLFEPGSIES